MLYTDNFYSTFGAVTSGTKSGNQSRTCAAFRRSHESNNPHGNRDGNHGKHYKPFKGPCMSVFKSDSDVLYARAC